MDNESLLLNALIDAQIALQKLQELSADIEGEDSAKLNEIPAWIEMLEAWQGELTLDDERDTP